MDIIKKSLKNNDIIQVLKIKPFLNLMLSEFFSQTAFNMQHFVIIFIVYEFYHSNSAVSGVILSFTIPAILLSVIAGIYVDRWNKKWVLFLTNFIRAIILLLFLLPFVHNLAFTYFLTFLLAVVTQFFLPAEAPMIPLLVKEKFAVSANAIFGIGIYTTVLFGYILAGPALISLGRTGVFIFMSALFFISAILILFIKFTPKKQKKLKEMEENTDSFTLSFLKEFKAIVKFVKKTKKVTSALALLTFAQMIIFVFATLGPGYVSEILDTQVENLSYVLLAPAAFGMIVGSLVMGSFAKKIKTTNSIVMGFLVAGIVFALLPFGSKVTSYNFVHTINSYLPHTIEFTISHFIIFLIFLAGVANALIFVPSNSVIQLETSHDFRGRIYGLLNALVGAVSILPVAIAGWLADIVGVGSVIFALGISIFILGLIMMSGFMRKLIKV